MMREGKDRTRRFAELRDASIEPQNPQPRPWRDKPTAGIKPGPHSVLSRSLSASGQAPQVRGTPGGGTQALRGVYRPSAQIRWRVSTKI